MTRHLAPHTFIVAVGLVVGILFGAVVLNTHPPLFGWLFGAGMGLTGGAFVAAIASGQQLISGPAPNPADFDLRYEDVANDVLPPPRRDAPPE